MIENSPQLVSDIKPQIPKTQGAPRRKNVKKIYLGKLFSNYRKSKNFFKL